MTATERTKALREQRRQSIVRKRIAAQVANLDAKDEEDALDWIENVSEFDEALPLSFRGAEGEPGTQIR